MAMKPTEHPDLSVLYREGGANGPSSEIDQRILMAAHTAVATKPPVSRWSRWRLPIGAFASICLVVATTVLLERRDTARPLATSIALNDHAQIADRAASSSPAPVAAESRSRIEAPLPAEMNRETKALARAPASLPPSPPAVPSQSIADAGNQSPAIARAITSESAAGASVARSDAALNATAGHAAKSADLSRSVASPSVQDRLRSIKVLIEQRRFDEARDRLREFTRDYPGEPVPEHIKAALRTAAPDDASK